MSVSRCCIAVIISIRIRIGDEALDCWTLPIKPNSIVPVLFTLAKSELLIPVVE